MKQLHLLLLCQFVAAFDFQLPFSIPFFKASAPLKPEELDDLVPRVAIIGAGPAGSSAAFWLQKAKERFSLNFEVDVYEKSNYIGGRSTVVYPHDDTTLAPIELGASIFVKPNKNLWRASEEFNLSRRAFRDDSIELGIWDGQNLRIQLSNSWSDTLRAIWRYGILSPRRTTNAVDDMIKTYLRLYSPNPPRWEVINDLVKTLDWSDLISQHTAEYFQHKAVSDRYIAEVIEAATRVNYGQNSDTIHAFGGSASMAANSAVSIEGGNFQMFEKFLENATVHINTTVHKIVPKSPSSHHWTLYHGGGVKNYKAVIIAFPLPGSEMELPPAMKTQVPDQPYVHLHVTLLSTRSPTVNPSVLNLTSSTKPPRTILTTYDGARAGGPEPEFNSLSYHGQIREGEYYVKIFSKTRISDEWLDNTFGKGNVTWVHRKEWDAYPVLSTNVQFAPVRLNRGLFYVNAFEPLISTMETQTIASRNVVDLLLNEEFGSSICGSRIASSSLDGKQTHGENFVYGWDC